MFCPWCKSSNIIELQPTVVNNQVRKKSNFSTWKSIDDEREIIPAFNFQCGDCDTKFSVNHQ